jgi:hypothetical protein
MCALDVPGFLLQDRPLFLRWAMHEMTNKKLNALPRVFIRLVFSLELVNNLPRILITLAALLQNHRTHLPGLR